MQLVNYKTTLLQGLVSGESYALNLIERIAERTDGQVRLSQGRVSRALRSLEHKGLLRSLAVKPIPDRRGRPRHYYKLTAKGRRVAGAQRAIAGALFGFSLEPV